MHWISKDILKPIWNKILLATNLKQWSVIKMV